MNQKESSNPSPNQATLPPQLTRRVAPVQSWYQKHEISTVPPPKESLFWTLWNNSQAIAEEALNTGFIQGIKHGTLDPRHYGAYVIQDAYYCFEGSEDYLEAANRSTDHPKLKAFLQHKHDGYAEYNSQFSKEWGIGSTSCLKANQAVLDYAKLETHVCTAEHPIYALIVMLPCEYLWYWLSKEIEKYATPQNLYSFWIKGNLDPNGAYAMGNVLDEFQQSFPGVIDPVKAQEYYSGAMTGEATDFAAPFLGGGNG